MRASRLPYFGGRDARVSWHKDNFIYLHILAWPDETLTLPPLSQMIKESQALTGGRVDVSQSERGVMIKMAQADRHLIDTIVKLELVDRQ